MTIILSWFFWSVGVAVVALAIAGCIYWLITEILFIITESRRQKTAIADRVAEAERWFSGFKDLDVIWDYIYGRRSSISEVRDDYARARNTDVYGKPLDK